MIRRFLLLFFSIAGGHFGSAQTQSNTSPLNDWENQKVFGVNKQYYHVNVVPHADLKSSLNMDYHKSPFYKSLNGTWKLNYVKKPAEAPVEFYQPGYSTADWKDVKVP